MIELAAAFAVSFVAGFLGAAVGLVLGTLRLPLILLLSGSPSAAAGTNIAISAAAAASGGGEHARAGRGGWRVVAWMGPPAIVRPGARGPPRPPRGRVADPRRRARGCRSRRSPRRAHHRPAVGGEASPCPRRRAARDRRDLCRRDRRALGSLDHGYDREARLLGALRRLL